jgi:hypothetical protein
MVDHEGMNFARDGHTTQMAVAFDQQNAHALSGGHDGRTQPTWPTTYDDNIGLSYDGKST